ncbi:hypothetical protein VB713_20290 [Anabaena cylindrica UHCC 0172]|nr:hypothetical protein [Anabaena cylindrica UHCC 0172]
MERLAIGYASAEGIAPHAPITPHPLRMNQWYKHSGKIPLQTEVMIWVKDLATQRNQN